MAETKQAKPVDFENASSFLVKERALMEDFADETRGVLGSANNLIEEVCEQAKGFNSSYYSSLASAFDETATEFSTSTSNTTDTLSADHRTSEIARDEAYEEQRKEIQAEKEAEETEKVEGEDDESKE